MSNLNDRKSNMLELHTYIGHFRKIYNPICHHILSATN